MSKSNFLYQLFRSSRAISLSVALFQIVKGFASIALLMTSASVFGADIQRDAWVLAWSIQIVVSKFLFGPLNETFRAKFTSIRYQDGAINAMKSFLSLVFFVILASMLVVLLFVLFKTDFFFLFAAGYTSLPERQFIEWMMLLMIPNILLSELIALGVGVLNSFKQFFWPEIIGLSSTLLNIILLISFGKYWGIYTLVFVHYLSSFVFLFVLIQKIRRYLPNQWWSFISWSRARAYLLFGFPIFFIYAVGQLNVWAEKYLISFLPVGSNTVLDYARRFSDLPITMVISIAIVVMSPLLSRIWNEEQNSLNFQSSFLQYLRLALLLVSPVCLLFVLNGEALVSLLLLRGQFDGVWLSPAVDMLQWMGLGILGVVFYSISGQALLVQGRPMVYAFVGGCAQALPIMFNFLCFEKYGLVWFACTWAVAQLVCGVVMFILVKVKNSKLLFELLRLFILLLCALFVSFLAKKLLLNHSHFVQLIGSAFIFLFFLIIGMIIAQTEEWRSIKSKFSK